MTDYILELAKKSWARNIVSRLPLPVSLPPVLQRSDEPWSDQEFANQNILFPVTTATGACEGFKHALVKNINSLAGKVSGEMNETIRATGLVVDASGIHEPTELHAVYRVVHQHLKQLAPNSRLVLVYNWKKSEHALPAALAALIKSLGRELGRKGSTANLLLFPAGCEKNAAATATWLLSDRSAFVSGQVVKLSGSVNFEMPQQKLLNGKSALITGASRGIGLALCQIFHREGAKIIGVDHPGQDDALQHEMKKIDGEAFAQDLLDPAAVENLGRFIQNGPGQIDIMIHNAGITRDRTMARMTQTEWDTVLQLNYQFPAQMSRELLKPGSAIIPLIKDDGRIVTISSIVGLAGNFGQANYAAAKGGVIGFTKDLAAVSGGVHVNAIACGFIETAMTEKIPPLMREISRRMNALKQGGLPADVAEACLLLAGPLGTAISGQTLRVCGLHPAGA